MTNSKQASRTRLGSLGLAVAAVLFVLYPALRPWHDESTVAGATASLTSGAWVASHLFAMIGFILVPLGLLALWGVLRGSPRGEGLAFGAVVTTWLGAGLTLPYYGGEDFGLHAIAAKAGPGVDLLGTVEAFRFGPVAATMFAVGLLLLGVGAILAAVAVWRSAVLPRYSAVLFGLGFALFIPQFFTPAAARVGHGVLLGIGLVWLAVALWRAAAGAGGTSARASDVVGSTAA